MIFKIINRKRIISLMFLCFTILFSTFLVFRNAHCVIQFVSETHNKKHFIKYVKFDVPHHALEHALNYDIKTHNEEIKLNWVEILAYLAAKYGGNFHDHYKQSDMDSLVNELKSGKPLSDLTKKMKYFNYYQEAYSAILGEFVGNYKIQIPSKEKPGELIFEERYGLKVFSPIAKTFPFNHYPDFGASRTYGYARPHLGHDLMAAIGTPVIAVESGVVEALGWNKYGGWRIGIRSFDKKRYYYYAHLRKNKPYHENLNEGKIVKAGDVIGYVGRTGYSSKENVNNIKINHLHLGMQLIFDESQKECNNEIWINLYDITKFLQKNKSAVVREAQTKQYHRQFDFTEESLENFQVPNE